MKTLKLESRPNEKGGPEEAPSAILCRTVLHHWWPVFAKWSPSVSIVQGLKGYILYTGVKYSTLKNGRMLLQ